LVETNAAGWFVDSDLTHRPSIRARLAWVNHLTVVSTVSDRAVVGSRAVTEAAVLLDHTCPTVLTGRLRALVTLRAVPLALSAEVSRFTDARVVPMVPAVEQLT